MRNEIDSKNVGTHDQWGYRLTWPDGRAEMNFGAFIDHAYAESQVASYNNPDPEKRRETTATAELMRRTVEIGEWEPYSE
jgi:hypothetical protein